MSGALLAGLVAMAPANLMHLSIAGNNFSGDNRLTGVGLPLSLAKCRRLETLHVREKASVWSNTSVLGRFPTIEETRTSWEQLHRGNSGCRSLVVLDLSSNQLSSDFVVTVISKIYSLRVLRLPFNNITGTNLLPAHAAGCPLLEVIDLGSNALHGEIMPDLCSSLPSLRKLLLPNNIT
jgi:hypothetical protein